MYECLAECWARRCMEFRTDRVLESFFGSMLRQSLECDVENSPGNGNDVFKFYFLDGSILLVTLNRDEICEAVVTRRPR